MANNNSTKLMVRAALLTGGGRALALSLRPVMVVVISTCLMTSAMAAVCPSDKTEYSLDLGEEELYFAQTKVVFSQQKPAHSRGSSRVRFDVKRKGTTVWSLSGLADCVKWTRTCYLVLDRKPEEKNDAHADITGQDKKLCSEQQIFIVGVTEKYLAFGGLNLLSVVCGKYFDIKVKSKSNLSDEERDGLFALPEYVQFKGCRP